MFVLVIVSIKHVCDLRLKVETADGVFFHFIRDYLLCVNCLQLCSRIIVSSLSSLIITILGKLVIYSCDYSGDKNTINDNKLKSRQCVSDMYCYTT